MQCIKTGCLAYLEEYGEYVYGDAFEMELDAGPGSLTSVYVFRLCDRSFRPINGKNLHFRVHSINHWFDEERTSEQVNSTLIATSVDNYGYVGKQP
jgi:hypothetical protein